LELLGYHPAPKQNKTKNPKSPKITHFFLNKLNLGVLEAVICRQQNTFGTTWHMENMVLGTSRVSSCSQKKNQNPQKPKKNPKKPKNLQLN